jgi:hypothetical protein
MIESKRGRPFTYDPQKHLQPLVEAVNDVLALGQVAGSCGVPRATFFDWIKKGDEDLKNNPDSDFAQLSDAIRRAQAKKAKELIAEAMKGKKNSKFIQWLLKVCLREDFGEDSELYKELLAAYMKLADDMKRIKENPLQGLVSNGETQRTEA